MNHLAAVLVFSRPNHTKFTILLGFLSDRGEVGAVIEDGSEAQSFEAWRERFIVIGLRRCWLLFDLEHETVCVQVEERVVQNTKYSVVSVIIKVHPALVDRVLEGMHDTPLGNALLSEFHSASKEPE